MNLKLKHPCSACPFRKASAPGYLGGVWTAQSLSQFVLGEGHFPCHQTLGDENSPDEPHPDSVSYCVGAAQFMTKANKIPRDLILQLVRDQYRNFDRSTILSVPEFLDHHKDAKEL